MQRCLNIAQNAMGFAYPNPLVGAVLVHNNKIISEGVHTHFGSAHAEVNCIKNTPQKFQQLISESTLYVNLEPCSHYGKTPPCANAIIEAGIKKVKIANVDPNPKVNGSGIEILKSKGVDVEVDIESEAARILNKRFFTFHEKKRPFIILKWAQSKNGYISNADKKPVALSNEIVQHINQIWRSNEQAILVGKNTVIFDNPKLNCRLPNAYQPLRVIVDYDNSLNDKHRVFAQDENYLHLVNNTLPNKKNQKSITKKNNAQSIADALYELSITSLIVEGGKQILEMFINENLWDEIRIIHSSIDIENGYPAPKLNISPSYTEQHQNNFIEYYNSSK